MKIKCSILWTVGSAISALLAFSGFRSLQPINYVSNMLIFFISLFMCVMLWVSYVTLLVSLLCWAACAIFPYKDKS
jgi:hypothetical protein